MEDWSIQKYHLDTHNLFYSAIFGEKQRGIVDQGYHVVGEFMRLDDPRSDTLIEPCYTVFDNGSVIFFDILEPGNITQEEIERVSEYNQIGLEAVERHLERTDLSEDDFDPKNVKSFDHCVICREEQIEQHKNGSGEHRKQLENLKRESCIATITPGGSLSFHHGRLNDDGLNSLLDVGIEVPETPGKLVYLPRGIHNETLAVAICEEVVLGGDLRNGGLEISHPDIRNHFGRDIDYDKLDETFEYLESVGACRQKNGHFTFTKYDLDNILEVRQKVAKETVEDHLESTGKKDSAQQSITEFGN